MTTRKRKTYYDLLGVYLEREQKHRDKVDRAGAKCIRAANYLYRVRVEHQRIKHALKTCAAAIEAYEKAPSQDKLYPVRATKKKAGRRIEL